MDSSYAGLFASSIKMERMARFPCRFRALITFAALVLFASAVFGSEGDPRKPDPLLVKDFLLDLDRGIKTGPVTLHAFLAEYAGYNDNLFFSESARSADFFFDTLAGARVDLRYGDTRGSLLGEVEYVKTLASGNYDHLNLTAELDMEVKSGSWYLEVHDQFRLLQQSENLYYTPLANIVNYMVNDAGLQTGFKTSRLGLELAGGVSYWIFADDPVKYMNHMEIPASAKLSYSWRKMRVFVSGDFGMVDFLDEYTDGAGRVYSLNDYMYYGGTLGASYDLSGKLDLYFSAGLRIQQVGDGGTITDTKSYTGFVANLYVNYTMSYKVRMGMSYSRTLQFSGASNYQTSDQVSAYYRHELLPKLTAKIGPRLLLVAPSAPETNSFLILAGYLLFDYRLWEWLHSGLRYDFRMRSTSRSGGSYLNNVVSLSVTAYF